MLLFKSPPPNTQSPPSHKKKNIPYQDTFLLKEVKNFHSTPLNRYFKVFFHSRHNSLPAKYLQILQSYSPKHHFYAFHNPYGHSKSSQQYAYFKQNDYPTVL
jgi:hypothetical protein